MASDEKEELHVCVGKDMDVYTRYNPNEIHFPQVTKKLVKYANGLSVLQAGSYFARVDGFYEGSGTIRIFRVVLECEEYCGVKLTKIFYETAKSHERDVLSFLSKIGINEFAKLEKGSFRSSFIGKRVVVRTPLIEKVNMKRAHQFEIIGLIAIAKT